MLCRLCLYDCDLEKAFSLFHHNGDETNVPKLIAKYVQMEITFNDSLSTIICSECHKTLGDFDKFIEMVVRRQAELRNNEFMEVKCLLHPDSAAISDLTNDDNLEYNEESLLDIKDVIVENDIPIEFGQALDSEPEDDDNFDAPNDFNDDNEDDDDLPLNKLALRSTIKQVAKKQKSIRRKIVRKKKPLRKKKTAAKIAKENVDSNESPKGNLDKISNRSIGKSKAESKERDDLISKHMKMKCELCDSSVENFKDLKTHFRETHKAKAFVVCCSQKFYKRFRLVDHIQVHLNPNYFQCKLCGKVLSSRTCMDVHNANTHADKRILKHGCTMCDRRFAHMTNLQAHMLSHSQERKFNCDACNKAFKTAYMLKVHKQKMHEARQFFICHTCGKEYKFKPSFLRHVAEHENGALVPTEECPICGKLLMPNGLRRHLDRHNLQDTECKTCGKKLKSKAALKGHIDYAHKKTRSYVCTYCDKTFKRPCVLKEHIAMHTGQKLYNCPNCPREFRSKANMYAHNKKTHRNEWAQAQSQMVCPAKEEKFEDISSQMDIVENLPC